MHKRKITKVGVLNKINGESICEFDPDHLSSVSESLHKLAEALEHNTELGKHTEAELAHAITDLTHAIDELRRDVLPAAVGKDHVPLKVFYFVVLVLAISVLGVEVVKEFVIAA